MRWLLCLSILFIGLASHGAPVPKKSPPDPTGHGYIGVSLEGLTISEIVPDTPAASSTLQVDDVITKVGMHEVKGRDEAIFTITSYRPGAVIPIEVKRGDKTLVVKVQLGSRPSDLPLPKKE